MSQQTSQIPLPPIKILFDTLENESYEKLQLNNTDYYLDQGQRPLQNQQQQQQQEQPQQLSPRVSLSKSPMSSPLLQIASSAAFFPNNNSTVTSAIVPGTSAATSSYLNILPGNPPSNYTSSIAPIPYDNRSCNNNGIEIRPLQSRDDNDLERNITSNSRNIKQAVSPFHEVQKLAQFHNFKFNSTSSNNNNENYNYSYYTPTTRQSRGILNLIDTSSTSPSSTITSPSTAKSTLTNNNDNTTKIITHDVDTQSPDGRPNLGRRHSTIPRIRSNSPPNNRSISKKNHHTTAITSPQNEMNMRRKKGSGRRSSLPITTVQILNEWLLDHLTNPYPTTQEKKELLKQTGLTKIQLSNWFINVRRRKVFNENSDSYIFLKAKEEALKKEEEQKQLQLQLQLQQQNNHHHHELS
ncbi:Tos8p NDAI_0I01320 [Naumovozyma dairenensis CBS 421]|uniref:Homeobox domain-containing protein n=1 Tax=Naumovozyma dairenensis (strain ATCC 10597 / BCRC 20456 / CBS 421 / NBRC 0211 / NRRL Y-12639) TaxID=1071378 RepID=G0WFZ0_NAUDC|nr:hypothetical protein NDAI_0I01320 [Naumovozyma dairenensis CBS 421]CCD26701.1 hypothetical protein NDAI_0I01320 [Naumovozyma dairenensis CBS 421]